MNLFNYSIKCVIYTKLFSLPIWDSLTLLPYCKLSSRIVDRHILASEGAING
jgi:hypothetical protein